MSAGPPVYRQNSGMTGDHYFTAEPTAPARPATVGFTAFGREFSLLAAGGVFSAQRLDPGTAVLLRKAPPPAGRGGVYLDLGCGYGPIAVSLAATSPGATVYAVDVNSRARDLTAENAAALGLADRVRVAAPDEVPADVTFSQIWSNPPTHVGKAELHALLERWLPRLAPGGVSWLVINRNLGGDSLHTWLTSLGWDVARTASQREFRVLRVTGKTD